MGSTSNRCQTIWYVSAAKPEMKNAVDESVSATRCEPMCIEDKYRPRLYCRAKRNAPVSSGSSQAAGNAEAKSVRGSSFVFRVTDAANYQLDARSTTMATSSS